MSKPTTYHRVDYTRRRREAVRIPMVRAHVVASPLIGTPHLRTLCGLRADAPVEMTPLGPGAWRQLSPFYCLRCLNALELRAPECKPEGQHPGPETSLLTRP